MSKKEKFNEISVYFDSKSQFGHVLFIKQHKTRNSSTESPTLLILNVPPYCDKECLQMIFKKCGTISNIHEQDKAGNIEMTDTSNSSKFFNKKSVSNFHVAYIEFEKLESLERALKFVETNEKIIISDYSNTPFGVTAFCGNYVKNLCDPKVLQKDVDSYMEEYDKKKLQEETKAKEMEGVADEDGWITVTAGGRNPGIPRTEANTKAKLEARKKRKRKNQDLFLYEYQIRESKREKIAELRKKFEDDKLKITALRKARKFKPF